MGKNAIVGQSGGPTSVINASLAGVFESCKSRGAEIVYGMCNGVAGLLEERVVDLSTVLTDDLDIELLKRTPSSFLGSCRYKLPDWRDDEAVYKKLFANSGKAEHRLLLLHRRQRLDGHRQQAFPLCSQNWKLHPCDRRAKDDR